MPGSPEPSLGTHLTPRHDHALPEVYPPSQDPEVFSPGQDPEVVTPQFYHLPEAVSFSDNTTLFVPKESTGSAWTPPHGPYLPRYTPLYPQEGSHPTPGAHDSFLARASAAWPSQTGGNGKKWKKNRWLWIGLGALALGIIAVLSTALGITLSGKNDATSSAPEGSGGGDDGGDGDSSETPSTNNTLAGGLRILAESGLATVNWTDASQRQHRAVAYQDSYNSVLLSHLDPESNQWSVYNLTATDSSIRPLAGTPLAMSVIAADAFSRAWTNDENFFQLNCYFLNDKNEVVELITGDKRVRDWSIGLLTDSGLRVRPGSGLAAFWSWYYDLGYWPYVIVQAANDPDFIHRVEFRDGVWQDAGRITAVDNTAVFSITPFWEVRNTSVSDSGTSSFRLYYNNKDRLQELAPGLDYDVFENVRLINAGPPAQGSEVRGSVAAMAFGDNGWTSLLAATTSDDSRDISISWWTDVTKGFFAWEVSPAKLSGIPVSSLTRFTAVALNMLGKAYLLTDDPDGGAIIEFNIDKGSATDWVYETTIKTLRT